MITDSGGHTLISDSASLTVIDRLEITSQPENVTVTEGETASFTVEAEGTGLTFKWEYSNDGYVWQSADVTEPTLTITAELSMNRRFYRCTVTDISGNSVQTIMAVLNVKAAVIPPAVKVGDLNGNGNVDNADPVTLARYIVGLENLTGSRYAAADMDGNGTVDNADVVRLARVIVGL